MPEPVHVAITRKVNPGCEEAFEQAILKFFADAQGQTDTLGAQLLRPLPESDQRTYGILRSFASDAARDAFYRSDAFAQWQAQVAPLVEDEYARRDLHGLEAFFHQSAAASVPPRWKMAVITWLGVWPTVFGVSSLGGRWLSFGWPFWLAVGVETLMVVAVLTWMVMPLLTRWFRPWLMSSTGSSL